jgi:heme exporter protein C
VAVAALAATVAALPLALLVAPPDALQGEAQRLMYVHVPAAWASYLAFAVTAAASVLYLLRRDLRFDRGAQAAAELGVGLTALAIVLGSLWARPTWGTWWTWDPRLVSTTVLLLVYVGYLGVRGLAVDPHENARRAAVVGVLAVATIPVVHFSVVWWRALHQPPSVLRPGGPQDAVPTPMLAALLAGVLAFTLGSAWAWQRRVRLLAAAAAGDGAAATATGPVPDRIEEIVVTAHGHRDREGTP